MIAAVSAELVIVSFGPDRVMHRLSGKLMKALPQELRTPQAPRDPAGFPTRFGDRGNPGQVLDFVGILEAVSVRTEGRQQTRSENRARTRETVKQGVIIVLLKTFFELLIKLPDRF